MIYNPSGQVKIVEDNTTTPEGWFTEPVQTLFALDGRTITVPMRQVQEYLEVGWYIRPVRQVWAADGRDMIIFVDDLEKWLAVGWYEIDVLSIAKSQVNYSDVADLANVMHSEANGLSSREVSMVAWCVLNRVAANQSSIHSICWSNQFTRRGNTTAYAWLAEDVLIRYYLEQQGVPDVGRTLPSNYFWFTGDGKHNYFRCDFNGAKELNSIFARTPNPYA